MLANLKTYTPPYDMMDTQDHEPIPNSEFYIKEEVDKLIAQYELNLSDLSSKLTDAQLSLSNTNVSFQEYAKQKEKMISDLIEALKANGPRFVKVGDVLVNLNNVTSVGECINLNSGRRTEGCAHTVKEIIKELGLLSEVK